MAEFVHLHLHSEYSLLDGACRVNDIPEAAVALSQKAVALTDHGVLYGAVAFYRACKAKGIKPIIGCEVYLASGSAKEREREYSHLVLLVKNEKGYKNLISLVSESFTENFYFKPRIDMQMLSEHSQGLIALSGCIFGRIPKDILSGDIASAKKHALEMKSIFGEDFYLEMHDHGLDEELRVNHTLISISREYDIPLVATNDVHYIKKSDSAVQRVLSKIKNDRDNDSDPFLKEEYYMKSSQEMSELFERYPEAIANTVKIADKCNFDFAFGKVLLPEFPLPEGQSADNYLRKLASDGLDALIKDGRIAQGHTPEDYKFRMIYELMVISKMGYSGYYLIVRDFIDHARKNKIAVGPGRGSGAGSVVAYLTGITQIDPIKHNLLFERFLNPERVSMPDFDTDFADDRREDVIRYVAEKYGEDRVCQIVTFGTLAARAAVRDVGRALEMPYSDVDAVAKLIPNDLHITINDALDRNEKLAQVYKTDEKIKKLIDISRAIEGMPRHTSVHAAGVVISKDRLEEIVPLCKSGDSIITQYDMNTVADIGLLKFDFLAIRYLTVISRTEKEIQKSDASFSVDAIPLDDAETFDMISQGSTSGVFQLESSGMKKLLSSLKPKSIEDIMVAISLFRPGPMSTIPRYLECRNDKSKIVYETDMLEDILSETYGCIVYQEQVMQIFRTLASYSYGRADLVRRIMAKKKSEEMEKERVGFVSGAYKNGVPSDVANEIFDRMAKFAEYAFCKSHAAAYSYTSYRAAYLKCHYPAQYLSALLSSVSGNPNKTTEYIGQASACGIRCEGPNINMSDISFMAKDNVIYFGLSGIRNIGELFAGNIVAEREKNGSFKSLYDFLNRLRSGVNKTQIESLIGSGAFDGLGNNRSTMLYSYEDMMARIAQKRKKDLDGQLGFSFDDENDDSDSEIILKESPEMELNAKLALEKKTTGMYFSGHLYDEYAASAEKIGAMSVSEFITRYAGTDDEQPERDRLKVRICGIINAVTEKKTSSGEKMAFVQIEDRYSECELIFFKNQYIKYSGSLTEGSVLAIDGNISLRDDGEMSVIVSTLLNIEKMTGESSLTNSAKDVNDMSERPETKVDASKRQETSYESKAKPKRIFVKIPSLDSKEYRRVQAFAGIFGGNTPLIFFDSSSGKYERQMLMVDSNDFVMSRIADIVGKDNIVQK